ncbi:MAG: hypothetical protein OHK0046_35290 [Anaerolineae bacterium]
MWLQETLGALPAIFWMIVGVGLPWALVALPRRDWTDRALVACVMLALGPALVTAWMFILGTLGQNHDPNAGATLNPMQTRLMTHTGGENLMRPELILIGTAAIALIGWVWVLRKRRQPTVPSVRVSLANDEKVLIACIALATFARWWTTSWLPFGAWDELWVYGYQGRIYTLAGYIPADIGYYPQFLPLQYAYTQILSLGAISDHAARAVIPFLQVGSILGTYILGSRLFNRRTGIIAAALWALYPHFGYWTRIGDLEIPLTFGFTGSAAFFLMAWFASERFYRRRYALMAGVFFGIAMWTKPTAGAFVWGVLLLVAVEFVRVRFDLRRMWPRFEVAVITGLACIPLGGLWYVRNLLLGHDAIVFPPSFWLTQALRSGQEFGWPLLALGLLLLFLHIGPVKVRPNRPGTLLGVGLIALGVTPTILEPARMAILEWLLLLAGVFVLAVTLLDYALMHFSYFSDAALTALQKIGWAMLLALPYFITWFYSYSYHYRLSFAIVPLMLLPSAVILAAWFRPARVMAWCFVPRLAYAALVIALALPGVAIAVYDEGLGWDWLWTIPPEGDYSKAALLGVVETLQTHIDNTGEQPVVIAPGLQTLPFFFPQADIRIVETPRRIADLTGVDYFINSRETLLAYEATRETVPFQNQWFSSLPRENVVTKVAAYEDDAFFYDVYALHTDERFIAPEVLVQAAGDVVFGDFVRYRGYNLSTSTLIGGFIIDIVWEVLPGAPPPEDYVIYVHLVKAEDINNVIDGWDGPVMPWNFGYYSTHFWEPGEYIIDRRIIYPRDPNLPEGDDYRLRVGFYNLETGARVPVTVNGADAGDGYLLESSFIR